MSRALKFSKEFELRLTSFVFNASFQLYVVINDKPYLKNDYPTIIDHTLSLLDFTIYHLLK